MTKPLWNFLAIALYLATGLWLALKLARGEANAGKARAVADYIAGMTDRYAILEHRRLFDVAERT